MAVLTMCYVIIDHLPVLVPKSIKSSLIGSVILTMCSAVLPRNNTYRYNKYLYTDIYSQKRHLKV